MDLNDIYELIEANKEAAVGIALAATGIVHWWRGLPGTKRRRARRAARRARRD